MTLPFYEEEKAHIIRVLEATNYNKIRASKILDIPRTTLWRKIKIQYSGIPGMISKTIAGLFKALL